MWAQPLALGVGGPPGLYMITTHDNAQDWSPPCNSLWPEPSAGHTSGLRHTAGALLGRFGTAAE